MTGKPMLNASNKTFPAASARARARWCGIASWTRVTEELPLFPLQTVLFPGGLLSLKVFEARYLDLASTCVREQRPFGVVALRKGQEVRRGEEPIVFEDVGVVAQILDLDGAQPGILQLRCRGLQRFRIGGTRQQPDGLWIGEVETKVWMRGLPAWRARVLPGWPKRRCRAAGGRAGRCCSCAGTRVELERIHGAEPEDLRQLVECGPQGGCAFLGEGKVDARDARQGGDLVAQPFHLAQGRARRGRAGQQQDVLHRRRAIRPARRGA